MKVVFTHFYVIVVAIFVLTTSQIIADHYGRDIISFFTGTSNSVERELNDVKETVKDWNKKILD
jgi:uncharacterized protein YacL